MKAERALTSKCGLFLPWRASGPRWSAKLEIGMNDTLLMTGVEFASVLECRATLAEALRLRVEMGANKDRTLYDITRV
jgi:hypothetical protein